MRALVLASVAVAGCGTLGDGGGAVDRAALPSRGADGWDADGRLLLGRDAGTPAGAALVDVDGSLRLFHARRTDGCLAVSEAGPGLEVGPGVDVLCPTESWHGAALLDPAPFGEDLWFGTAQGRIGRVGQETPVLEPTAAWEGDAVSSPHVVAPTDGSSGLVMFYEGGDGAGIGRAVSDDGLTWTREPRDAPVLEAAGDPFVRITTSPLGRTLWDLWYAGTFPKDPAIGFAGSFDGRAWSDYARNPVLGEAGRPRGPWVAEVDGADVLLVHTRDGVLLHERER